MLGRLEKVELRDVWKHEALDFTNWLAKEENIRLLSDTVGIEIEIVETEANVGSFNVDVLAKDSNTDSRIIIENQLERTDHDHLGKIITYASGYDAETIIWLVKNVRDEHRKAVEWLNNHLDEKINIFLIRIEVWKIGDSKAAPKFNIVVSPNNWAKIIKSSPSGTANPVTGVKALQLEFWTKLKEYGEDNYKNLSYQTPRGQHWYTFAAGSSSYVIETAITTREDLLLAEIRIANSKELYFKFFENKESIEMELGYQLEWMEMPNNKVSRITIKYPLTLIDKKQWEDSFPWLLEKVESLKKVFAKYK